MYSVLTDYRFDGKSSSDMAACRNWNGNWFVLLWPSYLDSFVKSVIYESREFPVWKQIVYRVWHGESILIRDNIVCVEIVFYGEHI